MTAWKDPISTSDSGIAAKIHAFLIFSLAAALVLLSTSAFWDARNHELVNWDDYGNLLETNGYQNFEWDNIKWMLTTRYMDQWKPIIWISFWLDYSTWGHRLDGSLNPKGFHTTNILFHSINVVLLFWVSYKLLSVAVLFSTSIHRTAVAIGASASAAFFGLHPLRTESVAWITDRLDVLCTFFSLLVVLIYVSQVSRKGSLRGAWLVVAVVLYVFALGSKGTAMTLFGVLLIVDVYPLRRLGSVNGWGWQRSKSVWLEKIPFFVFGVLGGLAALWGKSQPGLVSLEHHSLIDRFLQACIGIWFYVLKTCLPFKLTPLYQTMRDMDRFGVETLLAILFVLSTTAYLIHRRQGWPWALSSWAYYVVTLSPVLGFTQSGAQPVADRYSYLPCLSFAVLFGAAVMRLIHMSVSHKLPLVLALPAYIGIGTVLAALYWGSVRQTRIWSDSLTLWAHALDLDPRNTVAATRLASALVQHGKVVKAEEVLEKVHPKDGRIHAELGKVLLLRRDYKSAYRHLQLALQHTPDHYQAHTTMGELLMEVGRWDEARTHLLTAIQTQEESWKPRRDLGMLYIQEKKYTKAIEEIDKAITLRPTDAELHNLKGMCLASLGDKRGAIMSYHQSLTINPRHFTAIVNLANVYADMGELLEASAQYEKALAVNPTLVTIYVNYGALLQRQGQVEKAKECYGRALEIDPSSEKAAYRLARLLLDERLPNKAMDLLDIWLNRNNDNAFILNNLKAWILCTSKEMAVRNGEEGLRLAKRLSIVAERKDPAVLDTLGAAYAETGQFDKAVAAAEEALALLSELGNDGDKTPIEKRLQLYREGRPYRE